MKPVKTALSDCTAPKKTLFLITQFSWGKTDKVNGALVILSSV